MMVGFEFLGCWLRSTCTSIFLQNPRSEKNKQSTDILLEPGVDFTYGCWRGPRDVFGGRDLSESAAPVFLLLLFPPFPLVGLSLL